MLNKNNDILRQRCRRSWCDVDHDLISPWSESESLETALMDNLTVSCLCSSEKDFISRLYMAVRKKKKKKNYCWLQSREPTSQTDMYLSQWHTLFCFECQRMFQTPMNIHKHGMALKGQSGLCFAASALGSDWQRLKPFSSPGDYQRHNGVWDTESTAQGNFVKCWLKLIF